MITKQQPREVNTRYRREWRAKNPGRDLATTKRYAKRHPDRVRATLAKRAASGANQREHLEWTRKNKGHVNAYQQKRYADKINATPKWADLVKIREFYANCPNGFQVDHVIPLKGKTVCGLHVENNLQYLTKRENQVKNNKLLDQ